MFHLSQRVAWHDNRWNGTVCRSPIRNTYCVALDNIRTAKDEVFEDSVKGVEWRNLEPRQLPPCISEAATFMSPFPVRRLMTHPYIKTSKDTHGHLRPTMVDLPAHSFFAVPFWWMLKENQAAVEAKLADPLPADVPAPWDRNPWVFGGRRQKALVESFFDKFKPEQSLVFFYCKEGQPFGDYINRLIVGVGTITKVGKLQWYDSDPKSNKDPFPMWDRVVQHSIRHDGTDGFLVPYHDYFEPTGDNEKDAYHRELAAEIAVAVAPEHVRTFSYFSDYAGWDAALSALAGCMNALQLVKQHGVAKGQWERQEEWLNAQMAAVWRDRGAFPGLGSALEALGIRLGTALSYDMSTSGMLKATDDPWPIVDAMLRGEVEPPKPATYLGALNAARKTWTQLTDERQALIKLLSRFDFLPEQTMRWYDPVARRKFCESFATDAEILTNPYRIAELDQVEIGKSPITVSTIDRGLLPDSTISAQHPVPEPSQINSHADARRVRSVLVQVLRSAAENGDSLLSEQDVLSRMAQVQLPHPCEVSSDWIAGNRAALSEMIDYYAIERDETEVVNVLQLTTLKRREELLRRIIQSRARKEVASTGEDWRRLLIHTLGVKQPHPSALDEQAQALEQITTRRLSVLTGRAGTGKTSTLGALLRCEPINRSGILLLAPTGKARVRLNRAVGQDVALTIGQFLYRQGAYDGALQRSKPDMAVKEKYAKERTVVIDECSMLNMNDFVAILNVLDLGHVQRIILVGDPNQLPPIGVGRPFADICASMELAKESGDEDVRNFGYALGRLTIEVRTVQTGEPSDLLKLASWFTREAQLVDADDIFSKLDAGSPLNDLEYYFWDEPEQLYGRLFDLFQVHFGLESADDYRGFNRAIGINGGNDRSVEDLQILSPVRMEPHGVYAVNHLIQKQYRRGLRRNPLLGDENIGLYDKVIQVRNQERRAYRPGGNLPEKTYIANGEIGLAVGATAPYVNVEFADRQGVTYGYSRADFDDSSATLELAYTLTVHKTQGSEFEYVFVIIPKKSRSLSRELLYTAFTRAKKKLILLIQGRDLSLLLDYSRPERSETVRRNTNLFTGAVRGSEDEIPFSEHLIHRAEKGHLVRSKSELVIANMLFGMKLDYQYEARYVGDDGRVVLPDFRFTDPAGDVIIWEHLGMLSKDDYRQSWERKLAWYGLNGFAPNTNLFVTSDDDKGGLDSLEVRRIAEAVQARL